MTIDEGSASSVVAGPGACLVSASPGGPKQPVVDRVDRVRDEFREQVADFVDSERNQLIGGCDPMGAFVGSDDGEEGVGEHDEGRVPMPGRPLADLVLIEADLAPKQRFYRPPGDPPPTTRLG